MILGFVTQTLSFERGSEMHASVARWITLNVVALVVLLSGAFISGDGRIVAWLASAAIVVAAMIDAGRGDWLVRSGHFAERHALIVIVALGEVIVAIGLPVVVSLDAGDELPGRTVAALVASGSFAGLLWWGYFDRPGPALEHRGGTIEGDRARGNFARDVYTWAHMPIVAGIIVSAAALETITLHPSDQVETPFRLMLVGGIALGVVGIAVASWRAFRMLPRERIAFAVVVAVVIPIVGAFVAGIVLLVIVVVLMALTFALEGEHLASAIKPPVRSTRGRSRAAHGRR
jgi:low temperature requirement protein LtrA